MNEARQVRWESLSMETQRTVKKLDVLIIYGRMPLGTVADYMKSILKTDNTRPAGLDVRLKRLYMQLQLTVLQRLLHKLMLNWLLKANFSSS